METQAVYEPLLNTQQDPTLGFTEKFRNFCDAVLGPSKRKRRQKVLYARMSFMNQGVKENLRVLYHCCATCEIDYYEFYRGTCLHKILFETWGNRCSKSPDIEAMLYAKDKITTG